jgi:hypothetical protein
MSFAKPPNRQRLGVVVVMSLDLGFTADFARLACQVTSFNSRVNCNVCPNLLGVGDLVATDIAGMILGNPALPVVIAMALLVRMLH